ncbi:MAG: hypothetical protein IVW52_13855 [Acidimicrobiales bacterium]|nr:hypothetical protein [Acidimicrobiales bacterium]
MNGQQVGILGAGRQALESSGYFSEVGIVTEFFVEESPPDYDRRSEEYGAPILTFDDDLGKFAELPVISAVGSPEARRRLVGRWVNTDFMTLKSGRAWIADTAEIGMGSTVAPLAALNRAVRIASHVVVNVGALLSHDVSIGAFSTIGPGCRIGGKATIGTDVVIGIGSTVIDKVTIGDGAFIAAGAVVIADVGDNQVVMGVPARSKPIKDWRR